MSVTACTTQDRRCNRISFFRSSAGEKIQISDNQGKSDDIDHYQISVDGKELKSTNVAGPKQKSSEAKEETSEAKQESSKPNEKTTEETSKATEDSSQAAEEDNGAEETSDANEENDETTSGSFWQQDLFTIKSWKKSVIPFERNQTRDVTIHYKARYSENDESVSDDSHISNATFAYSLSPASTWKGPIGKGQDRNQHSASRTRRRLDPET